jgi:hypothetical protein
MNLAHFYIRCGKDKSDSDVTIYLCRDVLGFYACKELTKGFSGCIYTLNVLLESSGVPGCAEKVM